MMWQQIMMFSIYFRDVSAREVIPLMVKAGGLMGQLLLFICTTEVHFCRCAGDKLQGGSRICESRTC